MVVIAERLERVVVGGGDCCCEEADLVKFDLGLLTFWIMGTTASAMGSSDILVDVVV